jgi:UDP-N-acetylglucosamine--N-acetylmuramyl-(pentapeptide) pyrophosphoryl-undecaprenol N-acetylglucosamine transferase
VRDAYAEHGWNQADVREYIDDMMGAFAMNDLIVSRAGATTSAELMAAGKAAIMVPLPGQLEQRRNAEAMQEAGAARMILQDELSGERLGKEIAALIDAPEEITRMELAARKLARQDAAAAAVGLIERVMNNKSQKSEVRSRTSDV